MRNLMLSTALTLVSSLAIAAPSSWAIDASHSRVSFSVPHMVVSEVEGNFREFKGKVELDEADPTKSSVDFSIPVSSINTDNADRDKHLKSADFFDAEKFPNIDFKSSKISKAGSGYKIAGNLTIRGITKPVTLAASLSNSLQNPWGKSVRSVKVSGKIKRQDFGLTWNKTLDKGGVLVGDMVTIDVKLELNK
ncbi:MAG: YceI family protein [Polyangiaceae bacterium]|nr:YceI family protein [Polyangiaceae bacterium]